MYVSIVSSRVRFLSTPPNDDRRDNIYSAILLVDVNYKRAFGEISISRIAEFGSKNLSKSLPLAI